MNTIRKFSAQSLIFTCICGLSLLALSGCTSRGMTITSDPQGAEVSINRRVVGHTPIRVGFTHYGVYRIELRERNYVTLIKEESVKPTAYGYDPAAFVADNVIPARLNDEIYFHYILKPLEEKTDRAALMQRAELARAGTVTNLKTGEQSLVELKREPKLVSKVDAAMVENKESPVTVTLSSEADLPQASSAQKPEGLRLAEQYGITSTPSTEKPPSTDAAQNNDKKSAASTPLRVPKDEELIYDKLSAPDAEQKKKTTDTDKTLDQKKDNH